MFSSSDYVSSARARITFHPWFHFSRLRLAVFLIGLMSMAVGWVCLNRYPIWGISEVFLAWWLLFAVLTNKSALLKQYLTMSLVQCACSMCYFITHQMDLLGVPLVREEDSYFIDLIMPIIAPIYGMFSALLVEFYRQTRDLRLDHTSDVEALAGAVECDTPPSYEACIATSTSTLVSESAHPSTQDESVPPPSYEAWLSMQQKSTFTNYLAAPVHLPHSPVHASKAPVHSSANCDSLPPPYVP